MIRALPVFDLFRHGRAESALRHDPVVLISSFVPQPVGVELEHRVTPVSRRELRIRWIASEERKDRLRMSWSADREGGRQP